MILDPTLTTAYILLATALAIAPGPDVLFVVANGMQHRVKGAIASALGIGAGSVLHALAAALGISAIVAASPTAFEILRYAGAAYLAYLGVQAFKSWWNHSNNLDPNQAVVEVSVWNVFRRGLVTNILNPKVVVFYLALLPQFINVELGNIGLQIFLLGCIHNVIGITFLICIGLAAGKASGWLARTSFGKWMDGIAGVFFLGLAVRLLVSGKPEQ
ncbi:LysE family translocator [Roseibium marinum]|uniref:Threonine/homoserine/homoserine lactone efflux protein n=1 Tax=Roseibium marinum TaxID=281252 RepID=A0A2S3UX77_9HYPH|nr:LysE family translocator [Roseibium marinum]POF32286.1 threonine/homoserine/homoserine lactone efflux protein [Roseibium marinum]